MFPYIWLFSEDDNLIIYKYYYEITVSQTNEVKGVNTGVSRLAVGEMLCLKLLLQVIYIKLTTKFPMMCSSLSNHKGYLHNYIYQPWIISL